MTPFPFATVGFDLDGTMLDTSADLAGAVNHALAGLGRAALPVADVLPLVGGGSRQMLARALDVTGGPIAEAALDVAHDRLRAWYGAHLADHARPYPGLLPALDALAARGATLAVVSNKLEGFTRLLLERLGLIDRFACVLGGDTLGPGRGKPAPDLLLAMAQRCGGPIAYVGDSRYDVAAARAAGMPVIACAWGFSAEPVAGLGADAVIAGFDELIPAFERLAA